MALNNNAQKITIVGCGPGALDYLAPAARREIEAAEVLVGAPRLLELFPDAGEERIVVRADVPAVLDRVAERAGSRKIVVLVTGDPGVCSLAQPVLRRFGAELCHIVPGISSVQVAFARLGLDWFGARLLSAHSGTPQVEVAELAKEEKIALLAGNATTMPWVLALAHQLETTHAIWICENLTLPDEKVCPITASELASRPVASRTIVVFIAKRMPR